MKTVVLASVALIAIGVSVPAHAADMAVKAPPPVVAASTAPATCTNLQDFILTMFDWLNPLGAGFHNARLPFAETSASVPWGYDGLNGVPWLCHDTPASTVP